MTDYPFVSIIIPVYNASSHVKTLLEALERQTWPAAGREIIIVDNGSVDDTVELLKPAQLAGEIVLLHEHSPGPYAARNRGMETAKGEIIALLDANKIPELTWLEEGVKTLSLSGSGSRSADLAGGEILFDLPPAAGAGELADAIEFNNNRKLVLNENGSAAGNLLFYRDVWDQTGPFPSAYRSGMDIWWTQRAVRQGFCLVFAERAVVWCKPRSLRSVIRKAYRVGRVHPVTMSSRGLGLWSIFSHSIRTFFWPKPGQVREGLRRLEMMSRSSPEIQEQGPYEQALHEEGGTTAREKPPEQTGPVRNLFRFLKTWLAIWLMRIAMGAGRLRGIPGTAAARPEEGTPDARPEKGTPAARPEKGTPAARPGKKTPDARRSIRTAISSLKIFPGFLLQAGSRLKNAVSWLKSIPGPLLKKAASRLRDMLGSMKNRTAGAGQKTEAETPKPSGSEMHAPKTTGFDTAPGGGETAAHESFETAAPGSRGSEATASGSRGSETAASGSRGSVAASRVYSSDPVRPTIAYIYYTFYPVTGGASVHGYNLARELSIIGYRLLKINGEPDPYTEKRSKSPAGLLSVIRESDLVYIRMDYFMNFRNLIGLMALYSRRKVVIELNSPSDELHLFGRGDRYIRAVDKVYAHILKRAEAVIVVSEAVKTYAEKALELKNVHLVENGGEIFINSGPEQADPAVSDTASPAASGTTSATESTASPAASGTAEEDANASGEDHPARSAQTDLFQPNTTPPSEVRPPRGPDRPIHPGEADHSADSMHSGNPACSGDIAETVKYLRNTYGKIVVWAGSPNQMQFLEWNRKIAKQAAGDAAFVLIMSKTDESADEAGRNFAAPGGAPITPEGTSDVSAGASADEAGRNFAAPGGAPITPEGTPDVFGRDSTAAPAAGLYEERGSIRQTAGEAGNLIILNNLHRKDVSYLISEADIGLAFYHSYPWSRWGFYNSSLKIFEYLNNGLLTITNVEGTPVQRSGAGYVRVSSPEEAVEAIRDFDGKKSTAAPVRTWKDVAEETATIFEIILNR